MKTAIQSTALNANRHIGINRLSDTLLAKRGRRNNMGKLTNIAWTKSTLNLAWGCTKVSAECTNCYMYRLSKQFGRDAYKVTLMDKNIDKKISECGEIIFVNSMSDTFHKDISFDRLQWWFHTFRNYPNKQFQILTKRPERAVEFFEQYEKEGFLCPGNCWIGTSIGIKKTKQRIDVLRKIKCKIHFISFEPVLEDLGELDLNHIEWGIIGGESDYKQPRVMKKDWADSIIKQCREQNVAVFFKQWGGKGGDGAGGDLYEGKQIHEYPQYNQQSIFSFNQ